MKKFEIQKRKAMLIRLAGLVRCAVLAISTPAFADRYTDAVCEYGCGSRVDWGGLSIMLLIIFWLGWFGTSLTSRASRVWYSLAIGSYGLWAVSHANFEIASVGWLAIVSVGLLWWLGEDQTEVNVKKQKSNDASDVDDVMHISKDKPSATTKQDIPSATISLEAISAEDQHKANKYRKLISYGYTFVPENNNVVSISPEGKREVIYTSFQLDDLIDAVEKLNAADTNKANIELTGTVPEQRVIILTIQQWEDGPWLARAYKARDAILAFVNANPTTLGFNSGDEIIKAAAADSEALSSLLFESGIEPIDSESRSDRQSAIEALEVRTGHVAS